MVKFKYRDEIYIKSLYTLFTFQYGTIQIGSYSLFVTALFKFTFQYGAIQISLANKRKAANQIFTFQYGAIQIHRIEPRRGI